MTVGSCIVSSWVIFGIVDDPAREERLYLSRSSLLTTQFTIAQFATGEKDIITEIFRMMVSFDGLSTSVSMRTARDIVAKSDLVERNMYEQFTLEVDRETKTKVDFLGSLPKTPPGETGGGQDKKLFWPKILDVRVDLDVSQREEGMKAAGPKKVLKLIDTLAEISISGASMVEGVP
ncbi:hypothetical protein LTS18_006029 [Coniosporium uncinatum]|uniref:Uncharacterized protein n=1 Tax=Coniosporium uncinatum TaxID=93489 RepID=A0ACC3D4E1_9PEZI|nr:hypothetical protein LTS18_006029 [Coniosporium uncinatum]